MPEAPSRSLKTAGNPQARMQQLLRDQAAQNEQAAENEPDKANPISQSNNAVLTSRNQDSMTDSNQDDNLSNLIDSQTEVKPSIKHDSKPASHPDRKKSDKSANKATELAAELDPVDAALLQKLGRAYPDFAKEASTLVSSRLPSEVVLRLDAAASLVKKHKKSKQDVIARGLILAFEELVKNNGEVEWYE